MVSRRQRGLRLMLFAGPWVMASCIKPNLPKSESAPDVIAATSKEIDTPSNGVFRTLPDRIVSDQRTHPRVLRAIFDVVRADLPRGSISHAGKIWNHVDDTALDPAHSRALARNGLRIGITSPTAWPAIRTVVEAADATLRRESLEPSPGHPLIINLGTIDEGQPVFTYEQGEKLVGKTLGPGEKCLSLDYAYHGASDSPCDVQLSFEIQRDLGSLTWEPRDGALQQVPAVERHHFDDLKTLLTVNSGGILVIGPSEKADNEYLVGSRFFAGNVFGKRRETMLFITPQCRESVTPSRGPS